MMLPIATSYSNSPITMAFGTSYHLDLQATMDSQSQVYTYETHPTAYQSEPYSYAANAYGAYSIPTAYGPQHVRNDYGYPEAEKWQKADHVPHLDPRVPLYATPGVVNHNRMAVPYEDSVEVTN
jgi:hypothetical protein